MRQRIIYKRKDNPVFCDAIVYPMVTEKSMRLSAENTYLFRVSAKADKNLIKSAVESLFETEVESVRVANVKPKLKRFKGNLALRGGIYRKAFVRLKPGCSIDFSSGV